MLNFEYIKVLKNIFQDLDKKKYFVLGSAATLSFTSKIGYIRKMNDMDVIVDSALVEKIKEKLSSKGYQLSTFIDKRMPFYGKLTKYNRSLYLRFSRNGTNIEILSTKFIEENGFLKFDLYPNIWAKIPSRSLVTSKMGESKFTTLDVNLLYAVKQVIHNTLGRIISYKGIQRNVDLKKLKQLVDTSKAMKLLSQCSFGYKNISFKIPSFLI